MNSDIFTGRAPSFSRNVLMRYSVVLSLSKKLYSKSKKPFFRSWTGSDNVLVATELRLVRLSERPSAFLLE